jgi:hypothetical protein
MQGQVEVADSNQIDTLRVRHVACAARGDLGLIPQNKLAITFPDLSGDGLLFSGIIAATKQA